MKNEDFKKAEAYLKGITEIVVFGAGETGDLVYTYISSILNIKYFLDTNKCKENTKHGIEIKEPNLENCKGHKIVIATNNYRTEIRSKLEDLGLEYNVDFFHFNEFIAMWNWFNLQKNVVNKIDIMITSKCTLNCRDCVYFVPSYIKGIDRPIDLIKEDIDLFFGIVDYVREISIVGGEPLLHQNLNEIIQYIKSKYKDKIGILQVITNGTILPNQSLVKTILDNQVQMVISNYTEALPDIKSKLVAFLNCMKENSVNYIMPTMNMWVDYGNPANRKNLGSKELLKHFESCSMPCRVIEDKKYFFCTRYYGAVRAGLYEAKDGYFCLDTVMEYWQKKQEFLKFEVGVWEKGYLEYCDHCNGFPTINKNFVLAAIQEPKEGERIHTNEGR